VSQLVLGLQSVSGQSRVGLINIHYCIFSSTEDGSRSSFRKFVFSSFLEFRAIHKAHELSDSENASDLCHFGGDIYAFVFRKVVF
jgi:hypothetical protein